MLTDTEGSKSPSIGNKVRSALGNEGSGIVNGTLYCASSPRPSQNDSCKKINAMGPGVLFTPHDALLSSRHIRILGYPCVINLEALIQCHSVCTRHCGWAEAHRFIHDSLKMRKCSEGIGTRHIASGQRVGE